MMLFSKFTIKILMKKKTDIMIMRSGFHFHHHETWFQKKTGLTGTVVLKYVLGLGAASVAHPRTIAVL